ncbi:hypothetical protein F5Y10DRAFT_255343 [Nemania abortiva]|nr:hypothetical protein F5Y10DRAFT_255343 [Nemania abortiva]
MPGEHRFAEKRNNRFYCKCSHSYTTRTSLRRHIETSAGGRHYTCDFNSCGKAFARQADMEIHREIHSNRKLYTCGQDGDTWGCKHSCNRLSNLYRHVNTCKKAGPGFYQVVKRRYTKRQGMQTPQHKTSS